MGNFFPIDVVRISPYNATGQTNKALIISTGMKKIRFLIEFKLFIKNHRMRKVELEIKDLVTGNPIGSINFSEIVSQHTCQIFEASIEVERLPFLSFLSFEIYGLRNDTDERLHYGSRRAIIIPEKYVTISSQLLLEQGMITSLITINPISQTPA